MQIYFIRHGETFCNTHHIHQHEGVSLSDEGVRQAEKAGEALAHLSSPLLLTSDLARATETANTIARVIGVESKTEPLFREMRRPSVLFGGAYFGLFSLWVGLRLFVLSSFPSRHYSDEENLYEVKGRVDRALAHLESLARAHAHGDVVVVSHAVFITLMLARIRKGKISLFSYALGVLKLFQVGNGSITRVSCELKDGVYYWNLHEADVRGHLLHSKASTLSRTP